MKNTQARILSELAPVGHGSLLNDSVYYAESPSFKETVEAYIALNALSKLIEARLTAIKVALHEAVESLGQTVEGNNVLEFEGHRLVRERRTSSAPDESKLRALLETRGVDLMSAFDAVQTLTLNPSKLQFLIDTGRLQREDVEALRKVTWAIKAEPNEALRSLCDTALGVDNEGHPEKAQRKARKK